MSESFKENIVRAIILDMHIPAHIIHNWRTDETMVIWKNGEKTTVKLREGEKPNAYTAFTAALAKYIYGSNNKVKKIVEMTEEPISKNERRNNRRKEYLLEKCTPKKKDKKDGHSDRHKTEVKKETSHS